MRDILPKPDTRLFSVLRYIQRSIAIHAGRGSAGYYHLWRGWSAAYPETTGYLIETLWDYYYLSGDESLHRDALSCTDWLCDIQLPNGAWPGGIGGALTPVLFDTGMIVFGMTRSAMETGDPRYAESAGRAVAWLLGEFSTESSQRTSDYVAGYDPAYNTRALWAMLYAAKSLPDLAEVQSAVPAALARYTARIRPDLSVADWSFQPGEPAFTHTIAYTWRGFLEAACLLGDTDLQEKVLRFGRKIANMRLQNGPLAGAYDEAWQGDFSFQCVTGNAQLSVLMHRLGQVFDADKMLCQAADLLYKDALSAVWSRGGVPGSKPIWGKYQRFRFPNWAAKFLLDAGLWAIKP